VPAIHGTTIAGAPMVAARRFRSLVHAIHDATIGGARTRKFRFGTIWQNLYGLCFRDFFGTSLEVHIRCLEVHNNIKSLL
jgi:hypothetical protein